MKKIFLSFAVLVGVAAGYAHSPFFIQRQESSRDREIVDGYLSSEFLVLKTIRNPYDPSFVVLATERDKDFNGFMCGSYGRACYFFIEAVSPHWGLHKSAVKFKGSDAISFETPITFVDRDHIRFTIIKEDGGFNWRMEKIWEVNLRTGTSTVVSTKQTTMREEK